MIRVLNGVAELSFGSGRNSGKMEGRRSGEGPERARHAKRRRAVRARNARVRRMPERAECQRAPDARERQCAKCQTARGSLGALPVRALRHSAPFGISRRCAVRHLARFGIWRRTASRAVRHLALFLLCAVRHLAPSSSRAPRHLASSPVLNAPRADRARVRSGRHRSRERRLARAARRETGIRPRSRTPGSHPPVLLAVQTR